MKRKLAMMEKLQEKREEREEDALVQEEDEENEDEDDEEEEDEEEEVLTERDKRILASRTEKEEHVKNIVPYKNEQRLLVTSTRGLTAQYRHLIEDFLSLIPHHKKDVKHDDKKNLRELNDVCEMKGATGCLLFEVRKKQDLYLWLTRTPNGPSLKFLASNVHTMDELRLTGNALHGSRPLLSFDASFDESKSPELLLAKRVLALTFGTPRGHPKSKPFVDRVMHFAHLDGRIWVRNYQIVDETTDSREIKKAIATGEETTSLVEIGPRFALTLIKIFEGGFSGRVLYENSAYISPNEVRAQVRRRLGDKYAKRKSAEVASEARFDDAMARIPKDPLDDVF